MRHACSECGREFKERSYSHCANHRDAFNPTHTVPVTVGVYRKLIPTTLDILAEYRPALPATRDDPAEPEGYEIIRISLRMNPGIRAIDTDDYCIRLYNGRSAFVSISSFDLARDAVDLDDDDLRDEIDAYLLEVMA